MQVQGRTLDATGQCVEHGFLFSFLGASLFNGNHHKQVAFSFGTPLVLLGEAPKGALQASRPNLTCAVSHIGIQKVDPVFRGALFSEQSCLVLITS